MNFIFSLEPHPPDKTQLGCLFKSYPNQPGLTLLDFV